MVQGVVRGTENFKPLLDSARDGLTKIADYTLTTGIEAALALYSIKESDGSDRVRSLMHSRDYRDGDSRAVGTALDNNEINMFPLVSTIVDREFVLRQDVQLACHTHPDSDDYLRVGDGDYPQPSPTDLSSSLGCFNEGARYPDAVLTKLKSGLGYRAFVYAIESPSPVQPQGVFGLYSLSDGITE